MSMIQTIFSKRTLMIGLIAGSGALAASSFAMPGSDASHGGCEARHGQKAQTQRADFRAQRLAGLKDKLKLQPEQEAAWQAFVNAAAPVTAPMGLEDRQAARDALVKLNTPQRLDMMLAKADQRRANMVQRAEVVKQFYAQLSPEQQGVFDAEALPARSGHRPGGHHHQQS
jgi:hypothetical protein